METLNAFIETILSHIALAFFTIIGQGILFAGIGLAVGIFLVYTAYKRNWFKRSFGLWTAVASLNYIFLPTLFLIFGGFAGVLRGTHSVSSDVIDVSSDKLLVYGQAFIADFQEYLSKTPIIESDITLQDILERYIKGHVADLGPIACIIVKATNTMFIGICMDAIGFNVMDTNLKEVIDKFTNKDFSTIIISNTSNALRNKLDFVFWGYFAVLWGIFMPFFLLPIIECAVHLIVRFFLGSKVSNAPSEFVS